MTGEGRAQVTRKECFIDAAMVMIGMVFVIESVRLGIGGGHRPGMGFLPFFAGIGLCVVACFRIILNFLKATKEGDEKREGLFSRSVVKVAVLVIVLIGYTLVLPHLGYLLSTFVLLVVLFKVGGFRRWILVLGSAFLTTAISYLVFASWLSIRFPKGFLGF